MVIGDCLYHFRVNPKKLNGIKNLLKSPEMDGVTIPQW